MTTLHDTTTGHNAATACHQPGAIAGSPCPIERGMQILGGKWKGSILWHLKDGPVRFNDLARQLSGVSKKMVTQRLQELEAAGLVTRQVMSTRPIAVAYEITEFGQTALQFLEELKQWVEANDL